MPRNRGQSSLATAAPKEITGRCRVVGVGETRPPLVEREDSGHRGSPQRVAARRAGTGGRCGSARQSLRPAAEAGVPDRGVDVSLCSAPTSTVSSDGRVSRGPERSKNCHRSSKQSKAQSDEAKLQSAVRGRCSESHSGNSTKTESARCVGTMDVDPSRSPSVAQSLPNSERGTKPRPASTASATGATSGTPSHAANSGARRRYRRPGRSNSSASSLPSQDQSPVPQDASRCSLVPQQQQLQQAARGPTVPSQQGGGGGNKMADWTSVGGPLVVAAQKDKRLDDCGGVVTAAGNSGLPPLGHEPSRRAGRQNGQPGIEPLQPPPPTAAPLVAFAPPAVPISHIVVDSTITGPKAQACSGGNPPAKRAVKRTTTIAEVSPVTTARKLRVSGRVKCRASSTPARASGSPSRSTPMGQSDARKGEAREMSTVNPSPDEPVRDPARAGAELLPRVPRSTSSSSSPVGSGLAGRLATTPQRATKSTPLPHAADEPRGHSTTASGTTSWLEHQERKRQQLVSLNNWAVQWGAFSRRTATRENQDSWLVCRAPLKGVSNASSLWRRSIVAGRRRSDPTSQNMWGCWTERLGQAANIDSVASGDECHATPSDAAPHTSSGVAAPRMKSLLPTPRTSSAVSSCTDWVTASSTCEATSATPPALHFVCHQEPLRRCTRKPKSIGTAALTIRCLALSFLRPWRVIGLKNAWSSSPNGIANSKATASPLLQPLHALESTAGYNESALSSLTQDWHYDAQDSFGGNDGSPSSSDGELDESPDTSEAGFLGLPKPAITGGAGAAAAPGCGRSSHSESRIHTRRGNRDRSVEDWDAGAAHSVANSLLDSWGGAAQRVLRGRTVWITSASRRRNSSAQPSNVKQEPESPGTGSSPRLEPLPRAIGSLLDHEQQIMTAAVTAPNSQCCNACIAIRKLAVGLTPRRPWVFGVFDGHGIGGRDAAKTAAQAVCEELSKGMEQELEVALMDPFLRGASALNRLRRHSSAREGGACPNCAHAARFMRSSEDSDASGDEVLLVEDAGAGSNAVRRRRMSNSKDARPRTPSGTGMTRLRSPSSSNEGGAEPPRSIPETEPRKVPASASAPLPIEQALCSGSISSVDSLSTAAWQQLCRMRSHALGAFATAHERILDSNAKARRDFGTTAVVVVCFGRYIMTMTCGDSSAFLVAAPRHRLLFCPGGKGTLDRFISERVQFRLEAKTSKEYTRPATNPTSQDIPTVNVLLSCNHTLQSPEEIARIRAEGKGQMVIGDGGIRRLIPGNCSYQQAKTKGLSINMSRALGHIVLSKFGLSPNAQVTLVDLADVYGLLLQSHWDAAGTTREQPIAGAGEVATFERVLETRTDMPDVPRWKMAEFAARDIKTTLARKFNRPNGSFDGTVVVGSNRGAAPTIDVRASEEAKIGAAVKTDGPKDTDFTTPTCPSTESASLESTVLPSSLASTPGSPPPGTSTQQSHKSRRSIPAERNCSWPRELPGRDNREKFDTSAQLVANTEIFLILLSDGVSDVLNRQQVAQFVLAHHWAGESMNNISELLTLEAAQLRECRRLRPDNCTAVVALLSAAVDDS